MGAHGWQTGSHRSVDMDYSFITEPQCSRRQSFSWDLSYGSFWRFSLRNRTGKFLDIQARPVNGWCQITSEREYFFHSYQQWQGDGEGQVAVTPLLLWKSKRPYAGFNDQQVTPRLRVMWPLPSELWISLLNLSLNRVKGFPVRATIAWDLSKNQLHTQTPSIFLLPSLNC